MLQPLFLLPATAPPQPPLASVLLPPLPSASAAAAAADRRCLVLDPGKGFVNQLSWWSISCRGQERIQPLRRAFATGAGPAGVGRVMCFSIEPCEFPTEFGGRVAPSRFHTH